MKFHLGLLLISVAVTQLIDRSTAAPTEDFKAMLMDSVQQCVVETKIPEDLVEKIKKHEPITSREGKCFKACVMTKLGIMDDDNKIIKEKMLEGAKTLFGADEEKLATAAKLIDECNQQSDPDRCESANNICECIFKFKEAEILRHLV